MRKILLIDGLGDFSIVNEQYKLLVPDTKLLYIGGICREIDIEVKYIDFRNEEMTKEILINTINSNQINTVFISTNQDNENYIDLLELKKIHGLDIFLLFGDTGFISSSVSSRYKYFLFSEKIEFRNNILNLIDCLKLTHISSEQIYLFQCDYSLLSDIKKYTIPISIGFGCCMNCAFCSIANTIQYSKSIHTIEKELDYLFEQGCKYFFIENHSFCTNPSFVKSFCNLLINKFNEIDYVWSFWGSIESLMKYDDSLCELLINSKLIRIELGVESVCEKILHEFRLKHNVEDVKNVIHKFYNKNLRAFQVNLIIGSPMETHISLDANVQLIKELFELFPGIIDFQFNYFYIDNNSIIDRYINDSIDYSKGNRKKYCFYPSNELSIGQIIQAKNELVKVVIKNMGLSISKMSVKDKHFQAELTRYGVFSQVYINYLSKGATFQNYSAKKNNSFYSHSWDIFDDIKDYTPIVLSPTIDINGGSKALVFSLPYAPQEKNKLFVLNALQEKICDLARTNNYTVLDIIYEINKMNKEKNENEILAFLEMLESHDALIFTKNFNYKNKNYGQLQCE